MKTVAFLLCLLCASFVWGQSVVGMSGMSAEPQIPQFYSHPQHASQVAMASEQRILETSVPVVEHGLRPLWEVASVPQAIPLGDVARALRQDHTAAKKATRVWTN